VSIGGRLRALRQQRGFSQGDLERASGLARSYISRVEHGHTVPSLETLERFAAALGVPLYRLFYEGEKPPPMPHLTYRPSLEELANEPGAEGAEARFLLKVRKVVRHTKESDRSVLVDLARKLAEHSKKKAKRPL
jgi:transcriptional regulator with XRE-family HTH domain